MIIIIMFSKNVSEFMRTICLKCYFLWIFNIEYLHQENIKIMKIFKSQSKMNAIFQTKAEWISLFLMAISIIAISLSAIS